LRTQDAATIVWAVGAWRSLVAHLNGVQGVGGSNPLAPTIYLLAPSAYFAATILCLSWGTRSGDHMVTTKM
jgi:hypothetical protein